MIVIRYNKTEFEYDVYSLIKAFFPKEEIETHYTCEETQKYTNEAEHVFAISYMEKEISIQWLIGGVISHTCDFAVDFSDRKEVKNTLKKHLYDLLKEGLDTQLPWGTLTGIRPTKIPMKLMEEGHSEE